VSEAEVIGLCALGGGLVAWAWASLINRRRRARRNALVAGVAQGLKKARAEGYADGYRQAVLDLKTGSAAKELTSPDSTEAEPDGIGATRPKSMVQRLRRALSF